MANVKTKKSPRKKCPVGCMKKPSLKKSPKKTYKKKSSPKKKKKSSPKKSPKKKKKSSPKKKKKSSPKKSPKKRYSRHRTAEVITDTKVCDMYGNCSETVIDEYKPRHYKRSPSRMEETITDTTVCDKYGNCTETVVDKRKRRSNPRKTVETKTDEISCKGDHCTEYWTDTITDGSGRTVYEEAEVFN